MDKKSKAKSKKRQKITYNWFFILLLSGILSFCAIITLGEHFSLPFKTPTWDEVFVSFNNFLNFLKEK